MSEYKRLTDSETAVMLKKTEGSSWDSEDMEAQRYIRLAELEDKIENGTLIELPCKVGDIVYQITRDFVSEYKIKGFRCFENGNIFFEWQCIKGIYINIHGFYINEIGKTVFLTKAEAEAKLKEQQNDL